MRTKANPSRLIQAHFRTLRNYPSGQAEPKDYVLFVGLPTAVLAVGCALDLSLPDGASQGILVTAGLLSAFFFGVVVQLTERAISWAAQDPLPPMGQDTTWQADFTGEIIASSGYASMVSILTAAVAIVATISTGTLLVIASSLAVALGVHLALLLMMILNRLYAISVEKLNDVATGHESDVRQLHTPRSGASDG